MNLLLILLCSPAGSLLLKWTLLLALGWAAHAVLRKRHPRWRLALWRGSLCLALALPLSLLLSKPLVSIPVGRGMPDWQSANAMSAALKSAPAAASVPSPALGSTAPVSTVSRAVAPADVVVVLPPVEPSAWTVWLTGLWALGAALAGLNLIRAQCRLNRLRKAARAAGPDLEALAQEIQSSLGVRRTIQLRVSDQTGAPFACGWRRPAILLPGAFIEGLAPGELRALLTHEIAHFRGNDPFWCAAWRWAQAIFWFHPLAWAAPSAHNLACEQEADRSACGELPEPTSYAQTLAGLTLRLLALPRTETPLALSAASHIVRRLNFLKLGAPGRWRWTHTVAAAGVVAAIFVAAAGCEFSSASSQATIRSVEIKVVDEEGHPIQGATITKTGYRVKGVHHVNAYTYSTLSTVATTNTDTTGPDGVARLLFPVVSNPREKEKTGSLILQVTHPEFSSQTIQDYPVDKRNKPIRLQRGITVEVSAYCGPGHQPVAEWHPNLSREDMARPEDWVVLSNGAKAFRRMRPGEHLVQLKGWLPSSELGFSEAVAFTAEPGKTNRLEIEMKPGIRLEGRIDNAVARPVKNARVMISVRPKEYPGATVVEDFIKPYEKYGNFIFWNSYRTISEDGSFAFESVPPGEADVVVLGDGFLSKTIGQLQNRWPDGSLHPQERHALPQPFPLNAPVTRIEVATEPTATLEFRAKTHSGEPVAGADIFVSANAYRMQGAFGFWQEPGESPFVSVPKLPLQHFRGKTDTNGMLVLSNIPPESDAMSIFHPQYQVPIQKPPQGFYNRLIKPVFEPGKTWRLDLEMEPLGASHIGK